MNILHVLSQFEVTGAEVYAATLASEQQKHGHAVFLVSDTLHVPFQGEYIRQAIGNRSYRQRWKNIRFLIRLIREKNIHVVHAHSRAASWVCFFAARFVKTVFISTVHGRQHLHLSSTTWNVYGKHIIAISETLKNHLVEELGLNQNRVSQIANGLNIESWLGRSRTQSKSELFNVPDSVPVPSSCRPAFRAERRYRSIFSEGGFSASRAANERLRVYHQRHACAGRYLSIDS